MSVTRTSTVAAGLLLSGVASAQIDLPVSTPAPAGIKYTERTPAPLPPPPSAGQAPSLSAVAPAAPAAEFQAVDPAKVLDDCIKFLQNQKGFYAELTCTSTLTVAGMERTNSSRSRVWLRRPDRVVWTTQGDGGSNAMSIDGKECTLYLPSLSKYTVTPITPDETVDDKLSPMVAPFGQLTSALLAADLSTTTLAQLTAGAPMPMPPEQFYGVPCHHLAVPLSSGTTAELWIAMGAAPIPVHMSVTQTLPPAAGTSGSDSRLDVDFRWKINVELPDNTFRLNLPPTAMKVDQLGGPNLAAANWKPATGKTKSPKGKPIDARKQQELAALATPAIRPGKMTTPPAGSGDDIPVPSLSQGLAGARDVLTPKKNTAASPTPAPTPQTQQMSTPAASGIWRKPGQATQNFAAPQTGSMAAPVTAAVKTAPDVTLPLLNGGTVQLSKLRGKKAVVLDFWATWCGPCKQAMPAVAEVAQAWRGRGVDFYAVNMAEDAGSVQAFVKQQGLSIPVAMDTGAAAQAFGVSGIPHLVVIGRDGSIRSVHTGASNNLKQTLMQDLQSAVQ